ncbi:hypothetical protein P692DRAFT_20771565 [Suillus brevipes Sb2]|nr:hypothetical protein P692DRAFT_20771565 [Suillus brevipes Sb2]
MFTRASVISAILLLISQASVKASTNSTDCVGGTALCCEEDSSDLGNVNDEDCQSYSEPCASGYIAACCYTVSSIDYYYCNQTESD